MVDADSEVILEFTEAGVGVEIPALLAGPARPVADEAAHDPVNPRSADAARHFRCGGGGLAGYWGRTSYWNWCWSSSDSWSLGWSWSWRWQRRRVVRVVRIIGVLIVVLQLVNDPRKGSLRLDADGDLLLLLLLGGEEEAHQVLHLGVGVLLHKGLQLFMVITQMNKHLPVRHPPLQTTIVLYWALILVVGVGLRREVVELHVKVVIVERQMPEGPGF